MRIVDFVRRGADRRPDGVCLTFWEREEETDRVTYDALWREASALATLFRAEGLRAGDPVVLFARSVRLFVSAFLGAQEAGLLPVPCPPPEPLESGRRVGERMTEILGRCKARGIFDPAPGPLQEELGTALADDGVRLLTPADLSKTGGAKGAGDWTPFACCQFSSGSGGRAKGVLLTHENVLANIRAMATAWNLGGQDVSVSWLPLFHDMGLACVLRALVIGHPCQVISPREFLTRPVSWLSLISRTRGTYSVGPNFAYALCVRRIQDAELAGIDLSSWRLASNGAEPVTREVIEAFVSRFAPLGFRPAAMAPGYGLAENTLTATTRYAGEGVRFDEVSREGLEQEGVARPAREDGPRSCIVSVGRPLPGQEIAIFNQDGIPLGERQVGEIVTRGDSVMHGYLPGTGGEAALRPDGWLLTGDLGYLADGELFVTGRRKDLIIRLGRNYYPQDLEEAAYHVPGVRTGRAAAFSVPGTDREQVVLAVECRPEGDADAVRLRTAIRQAVFSTLRFVPDEIVLLPPHAIPLTTSGKIMRPEARRLYLTQWVRAT
jgi:acyl-CoA synthetase (AMP-forming)/AMP-acid ligase II